MSQPEFQEVLQKERRLRLAAEGGAIAETTGHQSVQQQVRGIGGHGRGDGEKEKNKDESLSFTEYFKECHALGVEWLKVVTNSTRVTGGERVNPVGRARPRLIVHWDSFPNKQQEILDKLPPDHKFPPGAYATTRGDLRAIFRELKPIDCEVSLAAHQTLAVTNRVESLMKEIEQNTKLTDFGINGTVYFKSHRNIGETKTPRSKSQRAGRSGAGKSGAGKSGAGKSGRKSIKSSGKTSIPDLYCIIEIPSTGESKFVLTVEYKPPHKLPLTDLLAALDNMSTIDLDKDFIDEGGEEFGPKELVAAFITQIYSAMIRKGLQYGYIDTGEAMVFLHIGGDPSRVEYHLSCPRSDVHGDDKKMHLSAVSQLFAFVVQAIQAPNTTKDWEIAAMELPTWNEQYVNPLKDVMSSFEVPEEKSDPYESSSSLDETAGHKRSPVITRTASKSAHQPPDDVSNEEV